MLNPDAVGGDHPASYLRNTDVQWGSINTEDLPLMSFDPRERAKFALRTGDLLVCEGGDVGRAAIWRGEIAECYYQKALHRVRPYRRSDVPEFLYYVLAAASWRGAFVAEGNRSTIAHLTAEKLRAMRFPFPPPEEQRAIASFLDRKSSAIDELIKKKERLVELLQEKRQALVIQAVTKGIDQNAPMKDSGVDWIGAIPRHWRLLPVKRIGWFTGGAGFPDEEQGRLSLDLPFYKVKDLGSGAIDFPESADNTIDKQTARRLHATIFPAGSIVFAKIGAALLLRRFRMLKVPACIDNNMMGWVPDERLVDPCYAHLATALLPFDLLVNPGTVPSLSGASFGAQLIPVPELNEQRRICEHVTAATLEADKLIALNQEVVTRLREYRQTLISAAVTGQLDPSKEAA